jgi:hypothetical protein
MLLLDKIASNFFTTKDEDMFLKHAGIKWSKASMWGNALISLPITDKDHLEAFRIQPTVSNQFILVSYIGDSIEDTANMEHHVQLLTPLVVTPLPSDMKPTQAMDIIWDIRDCPQNRPVTNRKKLSPPKSFYGRVWFAHKCNQILCNCLPDNPTACINPVVPTDFIDYTAVILYFSGPGAVDTKVIKGFIQTYTGKLPTLVVVAQFFDPVTETNQ